MSIYETMYIELSILYKKTCYFELLISQRVISVESVVLCRECSHTVFRIVPECVFVELLVANIIQLNSWSRPVENGQLSN